MRIVIISREGAADRPYGLGVAVGRIAAGLRQRGHEVDYCSCADWGASEQARFEQVRRRLKGPDALRDAFAERLVQGDFATNRALETGATHVWLQDPFLVMGMRRRLWRSGRFLRPPFRWGVSEHGLGSFVWAMGRDGLALSARDYARLLRQERRLLQKADWIWSPSRTAQQALLRDFAMNQAPAHWAAPGYGKPELSSERLQTARESSQGDEPRPIQIVAAGRLARVKRYDLLIDALLQLQQRHGRETRLRIAAHGSFNDLPANAGLLRHPPEVRPAERIEDAFGGADFYVSLSSDESFGMANREALAAGLPALVASGGANDEVLDGGAWLLPPRPELFADALDCLIGEPTIADFWRQRARQVAAQWPDWESVIDRYEELLQHA